VHGLLFRHCVSSIFGVHRWDVRNVESIRIRLMQVQWLWLATDHVNFRDIKKVKLALCQSHVTNLRLYSSIFSGTTITSVLTHSCHSGKNDLTRRVTHREAVCGLVIHSIFDAWHYEVLWTYMLTRLQRYTCDFVRWILYITLHTTNLKAGCQMHFIARSQVHS